MRAPNVQADPNLSSRRGSVSSEPTDVAASHVRLVRFENVASLFLKFYSGFFLQVKENHKWWYKPHITREDAINLLKSQNPGTFIVRDSNTFPDSFGLALKVNSSVLLSSSFHFQLRWQLHLRMGSNGATDNRVPRSW